MPRIIEYQDVLERLQAEGLKCRYPNGGAFSFDSGALLRGWIGAVDATILPGLLDVTRKVDLPVVTNLVNGAMRVWREYLPGNVWIMPGSHWSYELTFGSRDWLPGLIGKLNLNLGGYTNAAAVEFEPAEASEFEYLLGGLLERLEASDFTMAFPGRKTVCTIHHHKQLWWETWDDNLRLGLDRIL